MRILFTTAWYPNRKVAGDGVFIQKHAQAISSLHDVAVLMVQTDVAVRGLRIEMAAKEPSAHLHELLVYVPKTRFEVPMLTGLLRLFWLMAGYLKGYRYIKRNWWQGSRPDVCHVNVLTRAAGLPWLLCKLHKIPYIITEHWTRYARTEVYPSSRLQWLWGKRFVSDAAYVCPVSLNLEQNMKRCGLENKHYVRVGNVVDTEVFLSAQGREVEIATQQCSLGDVSVVGKLPGHEPSAGKLFGDDPSFGPRFVHVSWMRDEAKNISGILRVLSQLKVEGLKFHMDFIGEGNDKERLMAYAEELGLNDFVSFLPAQSGVSLAESIGRHDAMVMFSNYENQPVSILEALSCGLPVIATAVGSIPAMLAANRGITVEPRNESQLTEVLRSFVVVWNRRTETERQQDGLPALRHQYVTDHHSPQTIARQFDALYRSAGNLF